MKGIQVVLGLGRKKGDTSRTSDTKQGAYRLGSSSNGFGVYVVVGRRTTSNSALEINRPSALDCLVRRTLPVAAESQCENILDVN
ncbi:hypothetical protein FIBSPDRAFT_879656 [Athelia psychrophila]|uniref:Uncharacterized protein n=1 Tax=Athelia psychrophila TaxID=1759441 RepID=A0A167TRX6_9AGAM|nr:hypothetical protein FIBSPDRAFT_879656 [Fibularhizoctonia sp. CBS 109695]